MHSISKKKKRKWHYRRANDCVGATVFAGHDEKVRALLQYQRRKRESGNVGGQMIVLEPLCCEDMVLETEAGGP